MTHWDQILKQIGGSSNHLSSKQMETIQLYKLVSENMQLMISCTFKWKLLMEGSLALVLGEWGDGSLEEQETGKGDILVSSYHT